jgi:CRISPR-associated endonuclease Csn1
VQRGDKSVKWYEDEGLAHPILSVRCFTGLSAVVPIRKDEHGNDIGFVKPGNNHHVAIYRDAEDKWQSQICTFWHAVERKKHRLPVVIRNTNAVWDKIWQQPESTYAQSFLEQLPPAHWVLELSMQQNEMLILGMTADEVKNAIENSDYKTLSDKLYRVQKISGDEKRIDISFRHHLETQLNDDVHAKTSKRFIRISALSALFALHPVKVKIDCLGEIKIDISHD